MRFLSGILSLYLINVAAGIAPIVTNGNSFFYSDTNERFYIRGLDYQPGGSSNLTDPLADPATCERDIKYFKQLGINTVRVYAMDNTKDHQECMDKLADAGIYAIFDVNTPFASIVRGNASECSYNTMYLNEVFASILSVAKFNNTLGYFAGNEVINDDESTEAATYVKAVVRDMKTFLKNRNLRQIPVGYSAADVDANRLTSAHFFNCGDDDMARVDMFGFNDYSWCGDSSFTTSGYNVKVQEFSNYSVPLFFSESGCNKVSPRTFTEIEAIYSTEMTNVFSGVLIYDYDEETNNYGLVSLDGSSVTPNQDFDNLQSMFSKVPDPKDNGGAQTNLDISECPSHSSLWLASNSIPDTPKGALKYLNGDAEPSGNGFKASTQWACVAKGNNDDDSSDFSSSTSSPKSSASSSNDDDNSNGHKSSKSSSKSDSNHMEVGILSLVVVAFSLLI